MELAIIVYYIVYFKLPSSIVCPCYASFVSLVYYLTFATETASSSHRFWFQYT